MENNCYDRVPKLRFSGFKENWEEVRLGEIFEKNEERNRDGSIGYDKTISIASMTYKPSGNGAADDSLRTYKVLRVGDIAFEGHTSKDYAYGRFVMNDLGVGIMSPRFTAMRPKLDIVVDFWSHLIHYEPIMRPLLLKSTKRGTMMNELIVADFLKQSLLIPSLAEQQNIADCLSAVDELISAQDQKVELLKKRKHGLMQLLFPQNSETTPRLRFPGFTGEWKEKTFSDLCNTVTPPLKLQSRDYLKEGKYPIVDQSQDLICGWTNDEKGVVSENPVIVFGDHTCVLKFIDFPFVQGADGVKIIKPRDGYCGQFVFQSFLANPVNPDGYKRHFSDLKEKSLMIPKTFSEQQIIAECLSTLDTIIAEETSKTEGLKVYKKGLMQQLFPNF